MKFKSIVLLLILSIISACKTEDLPSTNIYTSFEDNEMFFTSESSSQTISISSNYSFTIEIDEDWITIDKYEGDVGDNEFSITVSENDTEDNRVANVVISAINSPDNEVVIVSITQTRALAITSFLFESSINSVLSSDVKCSIVGNDITVLISELSEYTELSPTFLGSFTEITVDDVVQISGETLHNFEDVKLYTISNEIGEIRTYNVSIYIYTAIPIVRVTTVENAPIVDKETYVEGEVSILKTPNFRSSSLIDKSMKIKGRGNATWRDYPKKPYKIKLDSKAEVLGMPAEKDWVLLAEYCDKSLLRNSYGFELARLMNYPWYTESQHVELFFNDEYLGTYLLCEHVEEGDDRINISNDGFIIENDTYWFQEPLSFQTNNGIYYTFKYPDTDDIDENHDDYLFVKNYMNNFESVLSSSDFENSDRGYNKYIDSEVFAKWFIIQNILGNIDTNIYYVLNDRSSELQMGPIWDLEWSLGLAAREDNAWLYPPTVSPIDKLYHATSSDYYSQLLQSSQFKETIKSIWNANKAIVIPELIDSIDMIAKKIQYAQELNFSRWDILGQYISVGLVAFDTWEEEVDYTKEFLLKRVDWLDGEINNW